jgi:hypothetical protein
VVVVVELIWCTRTLLLAVLQVEKLGLLSKVSFRPIRQDLH